MKTIIIDDERLSIIALENMIKHFCPELELVGSAGSLKEAALLIEKTSPKLVFLDIQLSDGIGFELLRKFGDYDFKVVFVTAYNKYALQAFDFAAIHYLLKPINPELLLEVMSRLKSLESKNYQLNEHISILEDVFGNKKERLAISTQKEIIFIDVKDLIYCKADDNYTKLYLINDQMILASKTLLFFERILEDSKFVRPHDKYLVNSQHVERYIKGRGGMLVLKDKTEITVSVRRKVVLLKKMSADLL